MSIPVICILLRCCAALPVKWKDSTLSSVMQEAVQAQRAQVIAAVKEGSDVSLTGCRCRKGCLTAADLHLRSACSHCPLSHAAGQLYDAALYSTFADVLWTSGYCRIPVQYWPCHCHVGSNAYLVPLLVC